MCREDLCILSNCLLTKFILRRPQKLEKKIRSVWKLQNNVKNKWKIVSNFVVFSQYMNFKINQFSETYGLLHFFACHKKYLPPYDDAFTQKQLSICIVSMSVCQNDLINRHGLCCFVGLIVCLLMAFAHAVQPCHKGNFGCKVTSHFLLVCLIKRLQSRMSEHVLSCFVGRIVCLHMAFAHAVQPCHEGNFGCKVTSIFFRVVQIM